MQKPKVGILHYTARPIIGGIENIIDEHIKLFLAAGYDVTLIVGRGGEDYVTQENIKLIKIPEIDSLGMSEQINSIAFQTTQSRIETALADVDASLDVLIIHNCLHMYFNFPLVAALQKLADDKKIKRIISWCHDISHKENTPELMELLTTMNNNIKYIAVSKFRRNELSKVLNIDPAQITTIPNGVNPKHLLGLTDFGEVIFYHHNIYERDIILLMPVRLTHAKNIEYALLVVKALKELGIKCCLIISGPPDPHAPDSQSYFQEILHERARLDLEEEVMFLYEDKNQELLSTMKNANDFFDLYRIADVILMTSKHEGFGLPIVEAGITGTPIFSTLIPAVSEIDGTSVQIINLSLPPKDVAHWIIDWLNSQPLSQYKRKIRQEFAWQTIFKKHIEPLILNYPG